MSEDVTLSKNAAENRYELTAGDELIGKIDYRDRDGAVEMYHTEVNPAHGGNGYGQRLVEFALADARETGTKVIPSCPFISRYIDQHPDYEDLKA